MTSKEELVRQFCENIFAGNVEISCHTRKTPALYQLTRREITKNLIKELQKWQTLNESDHNSPEFLIQTDLVHHLIMEGRSKFIVHGTFEIVPPSRTNQTSEELRIQIDKLTQQNEELYSIAHKYEPIEAAKFKEFPYR